MKKYLLASLFIIPVLFLVSARFVSAQQTVAAIRAFISGCPNNCAVNFSPEGEILESPTARLYAMGTQVTLTAVPASGYHFRTWSGDYIGFLLELGKSQFDNPITFTVTQDLWGNANFEPAPAAIDLTPLNSSYQIGDTINLRWTSTGIPSNYVIRIKRFNAADPTTPVAQADTVNDGQHDVPVASPNFVENTSYYYTLSKQDDSTVSDQSNTFAIAADGTGDDGGGGDDIVPGIVPGWKEPPNAPTACTDSSVPGCHPPVNISNVDQIKTGRLGVNGLGVFGSAFIQGVLKLPSLIAPAGQFLTTNSAGQVVLGTPSSGPGGGITALSGQDGLTASVNGNTGMVGLDKRYMVACGDAASGKVWYDTSSGVFKCDSDRTGGGGGGPTDPNIWQKRVSGACDAGYSIRAIDVNGAVTCEFDDGGAQGTGDITSVKSSGAKSGLTIKDSAIGDGSAVGGESLAGDAIISLRRDCANGKILKWKPTGAGLEGWECADDATGSTTGGDNLGNHTMTLDLQTRTKKITYDGSSDDGLSFSTGGDGRFSGNLRVDGSIRISGGSPEGSAILSALNTSGDAKWVSLDAMLSAIGNNLSRSFYSVGTGVKDLGTHDVCFLQGFSLAGAADCIVNTADSWNFPATNNNPKPHWYLKGSGSMATRASGGGCAAMCVDF
ncbi:MAG: hypothetical protein HYT47_01070 [Candidatus Vogelbacteria bacterium]|nr:hypothetical protein [Candidatus Vogelbacteria bacterium]